MVTITINTQENDAAARQAGESDKEITFKNCVPFTVCISETYNAQADNGKNLDMLMPMYNINIWKFLAILQRSAE